MVALPVTNTDTLARGYIQALCKGKPKDRPDSFETWNTPILSLERVWFKTQKAEAVKDALEALCRQNQALAQLLAPKPTIEIISDDQPICPPLPEHLKYSDTLARAACPWLEEYEKFSKYWSPRGYEGYHLATAIAMLSTVAARRVSLDFGGSEYTPIYTALVGFTTLFKKTTTARLYYGVLQAAGLDWILGANISTPQRLLSDMAGKSIPGNYDDLSIDDQERIKKRLAMCGQRGWYYDEFGMHLDAMVRENGSMGDFKGLLRILDDCQPVFENATQSRGLERIEKPYLSLLASMTPADIRPYAEKNNKFWRDGLFARFAFVCPPKAAKGKRDRFPEGELLYPASIVDPLRNWHIWLGMPEVEIVATEGKSGNITGHTIERRVELPERKCTTSREVIDAVYAYESAMLDMVEANQIPEALFGSYGRLHKLALRIAMLLGSFDNYGQIELRHWAKAQQITEQRRSDLHELFAQTNLSDEASKSLELEDKILATLARLAEKGHEYMSANGLRPYIPGIARSEIEECLQNLKKTGTVEAQKTVQTTKYKLAQEQ